MKGLGFLDRLRASVSILATGHVSTRADGGPRGSRSGRRSALFEQSRRHINSDISSAGTTLRGRSRFLCRENGYVINMKAVWTNYAIGDGWTPNWLGLPATVTKALHRDFKAWTDDADIDERGDFYALQGTISDEEFEAGECFVRMILDPEKGLRLQLMQSEQLPYSNIGAPGTPDGAEIRLGIEFSGPKRIAYHFYRNHPGDGTKVDTTADMLVRIPAEEIIHVYRRTFPGQIRGYPRLAGAIVPMFKLDEYEDALLERAAQSAKYFGSIKSLSSGEDPKGDDDASGEGAREYDLQTGVLYQLDADEELNMHSPPDPGSNYDDFERRNLAKGCAAVGTPYAESTGDLKNANFSSARIGRQPFRRACTRWGHEVMVFQFCRVVAREWLRFGLLTGTLTLPRGASRDVGKYKNIEWLPPSWEYVNPIDDVKADREAVDAGFKPRSTVIGESGRNAEEVDDKFAADRKREIRLGLDFKPAKGGGAKSKAKAKPQGDQAGQGADAPETPPEDGEQQ